MCQQELRDMHAMHGKRTNRHDMVLLLRGTHGHAKGFAYEPFADSRTDTGEIQEPTCRKNVDLNWERSKN